MDAIIVFSRFFGVFCFVCVFFRAIILLQQNKPGGVETGKAAAVAAWLLLSH